jgi:hypothetical protein
MRVRTRLIWLEVGSSVTGCCEHDKELSDSIKCAKILDQLSESYLFKKTLYVCLSVSLVCLSIYLSMALQPFVGPWPLFSFLPFFYSR